jgi:hypothetical protein
LFALYLLAITTYEYIPKPTTSLALALLHFVAGLVLVGLAPIFVFFRLRRVLHQ